MAKPRQIFACKACGAVQTKWMGKCPDCGAWDALEAERIEPKAKVDPRGSTLAAWSAAASDQEGPDPALSHAAPADVPLAARAPARLIGDIASDAVLRRIPTGISELDRVLGGGIVPGSAILLGGDPGIGKSTILLQAAASLARTGTRVLYVSSEESAEQVKLRASRLGATAQSDLFLLAETSLARIIEQAARVLGECPPDRPPVLVIDSVQMIYKADLDAFPGSLTQLRRCAAELAYFAKASGVTVILVGHVTKDGVLAGPRLLEHLVDAVLYFEGDRYHAHRIVRAVKNRFGTTLELGLFEMTGAGLREAPEGAGLAALPEASTTRSGSVVCPVLTGSRCLLVELQALTATGFPGATKRKSSGLDPNRLAMLIAVLEQHAGLRLADRDVFASSVGGVRVAEPASDLALLLAIAGAQLRRGVPAGTVAIGEVGLGGEVRGVSQVEQRVQEARRLGFRRAIVPISPTLRTAADPRTHLGQAGRRTEMDLIGVRTIQQAIEELQPCPQPTVTTRSRSEAAGDVAQRSRSSNSSS
ncbi:MAG: DNA repair protein RadA, partial [Phycisphaerae bacterium]|nr:DNA repair protein RadA [Phycisphaerae bacterium]